MIADDERSGAERRAIFPAVLPELTLRIGRPMIPWFVACLLVGAVGCRTGDVIVYRSQAASDTLLVQLTDRVASFEDARSMDVSPALRLYVADAGATGAMLLGTRDFIDEAIVWQQRTGAVVYTLAPYVASAAMRLRLRSASLYFRTASCASRNG